MKRFIISFADLDSGQRACTTWIAENADEARISFLKGKDNRFIITDIKEDFDA